MTIYIFGNPDMQEDSLPLRIIPDLEEQFPDIDFVVKDPNEEWSIPENLIIIDTAVGIEEIKTFDSLENFSASPTLSVHDFDALFNLKYLKKLGKLKQIKIIGIPPTISEREALEGVSSIIHSI
jgi:Ni,Fe-hydrogenase maturation factor